MELPHILSESKLLITFQPQHQHSTELILPELQYGWNTTIISAKKPCKANEFSPVQ